MGYCLADNIRELPVRHSDRRPGPWRVVHKVGGGDAYAIGESVFGLFREAEPLAKDVHMLDLGCAAGLQYRRVLSWRT